MGPLVLFLADEGAHLIEAVPSVARFQLLPGKPGPAEKSLGDAMEHGRPRPVAGIGGQAREAEAGVGDSVVVAVAAASAQGALEAIARAAGVAVLAQHPAHVDRQVRVLGLDRVHGVGRLEQVGPGGRDVASAQGMHARVVRQVVGEKMVAGSQYARDRLGEQRPGVCRVGEGVAVQIPGQALAEKYLITGLAG